MDTLWAKMGRIYGHKWASIAESDDGTWLKGLQGLTPEQLATGLTKCLTRTDTWPPTLIEFRNLCLPTTEDLDLPDVHAAYRMAAFGDWHIPAVYRK